MLNGTAMLVLFITCANLVNALLIKMTSRQREIAVKIAVGANWTRLFRQFFIENSILTIFGNGVGLLIAHFTLKVIIVLGIDVVPRISEAIIDFNVILFTLLVSLIISIIISIALLIHFRGNNLGESLKDGARGGVSGKKRYFMRTTLVISELVVATILMITTGLMFKSLLNLRPINLKYD